jgi:hypothetical protein
MNRLYVSLGIGKDGKDGTVLLSYEDFSKYCRCLNSIKIGCSPRSQLGRIQKILASSEVIPPYIALKYLERILNGIQKENSENGHKIW